VPLWNRARNVVTVRDLSLLLHPEFHEPQLVKRARRRLPLMVRAAARIIAVTEAMKQEICEHLNVQPDRVSVTPEAPRRSFHAVPAAESDTLRKQLQLEPEFLLFVGTIEPRKNLVTLVRALDQIARQTSLRPQLAIAGGEGWLMEEFYSLIDQQGLRERIRFLGYTPDEQLRALFSACRICVYPSLYEGFGLPPLEAMACGAPVITSGIPAIAETVGDAAVLVDPLDANALAASIIELWNSEEQRRNLSELGMKRAAEFTWERTAQLTLQVYREVIGESLA
jgi:glycosyltransferase involved in cell wall biosynthesis